MTDSCSSSDHQATAANSSNHTLTTQVTDEWGCLPHFNMHGVNTARLISSQST